MAPPVLRSKGSRLFVDPVRLDVLQDVGKWPSNKARIGFGHDLTAEVDDPDIRWPTGNIDARSTQGRNDFGVSVTVRIGLAKPIHGDYRPEMSNGPFF